MTKQLLGIALKYHPIQVLGIFILTLLHAALAGVGLGLLLPIIEGLQSPSQITPSHPLSRFFTNVLTALDLPVSLLVLFITGFSLYAFQAILQYVRVNLVAKTSARVETKIRVDLFSTLIRAQLGYFHQRKMGDLVNGIVTEAHRGANAFVHLVNTLVTIGIVIAYLIISIVISWKISLVLFSIVIPLIYFTRHRKGISQTGKDISRANDALQNVTVESLLGIREIKAFGLEGHSTDIFSRAADGVSGTIWHLQRLDARFKCAYDMVAVGILMLAVMLSSFVLNIAVPEMVVFLAVLLRLSPAVIIVQSNRDKYLGALPGFSVVEKLLTEAGEYKQAGVDGKPTDGGFHSSIVFEDVNFAYDGQEVRVLQNINLRLERGKTTGIVGASGAGKSTLVDLIVRFHDPTNGRIVVDGIDLKEIALPAWRKMIGFVSQDTFLFNDTVFNNIWCGNFHASENEIVEAAKGAYAHEFIVELPAGYNTHIGDRGVKLSGGQRQRLALARAILRNPQIVILDEATSDLDSRSEKLIQDSMNELKQDRTIVIIAHRLSTIEGADEIIVLEGGRIVERGTHDELLEKGQYYSEYYNLQYGKNILT